MKEKTFSILFFIWTLICFAGLVACVVVAAHFIEKYW